MRVFRPPTWFMSAAGCSRPKFFRPAKIRFSSLAGIRADQEIVSEEDSQLFDHWLATGGRLIFALRPEKNQPAQNQASPLENQDETDRPLRVPWRTLIRRWGVEIVPLTGMHSTTTDSTLFGTIPRWLGRNSFDRLTSGLEGDRRSRRQERYCRTSVRSVDRSSCSPIPIR